MRFKKFYLAEKLYEKTIKDLKNLVSGIVEKDIPTETKTDKGIFFTITSLGAWANVKEKLTQALLDNKWKDHSSEANSLNFKNKDSSLFVEYKNGSATFFLTDDLNYVPKEDEENEV